MINVRDYEAYETLKDGRTVTVRAIRPDDKATILKGIDLFSDDSLYKRFHGAKSGLTDQELKFYTEIDYLHHVALLAVLKDNDQAIGGGRFIVYDKSLSPLRAELAFAVADNFQGLGMATCMFKHLVHIARALDIHQLEADVLSRNSAMIRIFEKSGLPVTKSHQDGNVHVTMTL
jgi:RimJ/RimL family protein N-acetyltransferase